MFGPLPKAGLTPVAPAAFAAWHAARLHIEVPQSTRCVFSRQGIAARLDFIAATVVSHMGGGIFGAPLSRVREKRECLFSLFAPRGYDHAAMFSGGIDAERARHQIDGRHRRDLGLANEAQRSSTRRRNIVGSYARVRTSTQITNHLLHLQAGRFGVRPRRTQQAHRGGDDGRHKRAGKHG
jgi:hypothetical protein